MKLLITVLLVGSVSCFPQGNQNKTSTRFFSGGGLTGPIGGGGYSGPIGAGGFPGTIGGGGFPGTIGGGGFPGAIGGGGFPGAIGGGGLTGPLVGGGLGGPLGQGVPLPGGYNSPFNCQQLTAQQAIDTQRGCQKWCQVQPPLPCTHIYICCDLRIQYGECPPVRPQCPNVRNFNSPPQPCLHDPMCPNALDKCCPDVCLPHKVCKRAEPIYG